MHSYVIKFAYFSHIVINDIVGNKNIDAEYPEVSG